MFLYTLMSDVSYLVRSKLKYFIIYISSLFVYLLFQKSLGINGYTVMTNIIGIDFQTDILSKLIFILNQVFLIFISYTMFIKDFRFSLDNIFLRTTIKKWLIVKILSIFIIIFFLKLSVFLLMYGISIIIKYNDTQFLNLIKVFFSHSLYLFFLQTLSILFLSLIYINKFIIFPLFTLILIFFKQIFIPMEFNVKIYLIISLLVIFMLEKIYIKKFALLFERSNV